jgi:hypothetical protein
VLRLGNANRSRCIEDFFLMPVQKSSLKSEQRDEYIQGDRNRTRLRILFMVRENVSQFSCAASAPSSIAVKSASSQNELESLHSLMVQFRHATSTS